MTDFFRLDDDAPARRALYLAALLLIVTPFIQAVSQPQFWPMQFGNINWRLAVANSLSGIVVTPFLGFILLLVVGRAVANRTLLRTVAIVSIVFALGLIGSTILFVFDVLQFRSIVPTQQMQAFNMLALRVGSTAVLFGAAFAYVALLAFRAPPGALVVTRRGPVKQSDEGVGLIVGR